MDTHKHIITCTLWNATSVRNKHFELSKFLNEHNIDIAITETWLKPSDNFKLRNYNIYRKDRPTTPKTQEEVYSSLSATIFPSNIPPNPNSRTSNFCLSN